MPVSKENSKYLQERRKNIEQYENMLKNFKSRYPAKLRTAWVSCIAPICTEKYRNNIQERIVNKPGLYCSTRAQCISNISIGESVYINIDSTILRDTNYRDMSVLGIAMEIVRLIDACLVFSDLDVDTALNTYFDSVDQETILMYENQIKQNQKEIAMFLDLVEGLSFPNEEDFNHPLFSISSLDKASIPAMLLAIRHQSMLHGENLGEMVQSYTSDSGKKNEFWNNVRNDPLNEKQGHSGYSMSATVNSAVKILRDGWKAYVDSYCEYYGITFE